MPNMKQKGTKKKLTKNQKIALYCVVAVAIFLLAILITNIVITNISSAEKPDVIDANAGSFGEENVIEDENKVEENNTIEENNTVNEVTNETNTTNTTNTADTKNTTATTNTTSSNQSNNKAKKSSSPYYIKVNRKMNVVTIYKKDGEGNYTVPIKAMLCSTGTYTPPNTLKGNVYKASSYEMENYRRRWGTLQGHNGYQYVYGQYACGIVDNVLFHSVTYTSKNPNSLEWEEFNKLGTSASAGCIRLCVRDVKWIYDNVPANTICEFYEDSNPGPLGKPTLPKISASDPNRNWDPTDPDPNNPWNKKQETPPQENTTKSNENSVSNTTNIINDVNVTNTTNIANITE